MKKLAELHGGEVHAESEGKGRGATFTVALPLGARSRDVERFDVILSDIAMPGRDGYELIAALRALEIGTPAIALTAFAHAEERARSLAAGYRAHVAKPVDAASLVDAIARVAREGPPAGALG